ncbi:unnamed protein product [Rhizoctonia solani]|uniref:DUF6535 domain-containing protein n=1 Tax=Rhizoctonia solani TaxID=456999 RepID=A0A8H2WIF2_9AGAM|nr:unnamed protein product [Rhizoctonia solani]
MSPLLPDHILGKRNNKASKYGLPVELGMGSQSLDPAPKSSPETPKHQSVIDPTMEPDEYGAELGKEARVWKVYVKEADRLDAELVDGWNKSLDVTLVFVCAMAALFSAISTAFLIESSKKLQHGPEDTTGQALLAISHTLLILVNTTQPSITTSEKFNTISSSFSPAQCMLIVNTLWYLSLSLSVAASFLAMLAKDWCHSFMAGRTGHPYTQTIRRQEKWMMIEKWKMQELLLVLPSFIHLALLSFAVGLCIYVWEIHNGVAIPVICVTGIALIFYLWTTTAASITESFPYTTVVSRFFWSNWGIWICRRLRRLLEFPYQLALYYVPRLHYLLPIPRNFCLEMTSRLYYTSKLLKFFIVQKLYQSFRAIYDCGCRWNRDHHWCRNLRRMWPLAVRLGVGHLMEFLYLWTEDLEKALNETHNPSQTEVEPADHIHRVTSLALHWLITKCETPIAVDTALQAIAGAGPQTCREPLEKCNAALEISKRLVSGNIHKSTDTCLRSRYVRALSFLGSTGAYMNSAGGQSESSAISTGELQVTVWNLQAQYEDQVAQLIAYGKFIPDDHNITALSIGGSIASHILRLLNGFDRTGNLVPKTIVTLLENHCNQSGRLHPAAVKSLLNASELLSICITDYRLLLALIDLMVVLASSSDPLPFESSQAHILLNKKEALRCAFILACNIQERHTMEKISNLGSSSFDFAGKMIRCITKSHSMAPGEPIPFILSQILEVRSRPDLYPIPTSFYDSQTAEYQDEHTSSQQPWISTSRARIMERHLYDAAPFYIDALDAACYSGNLEAQSARIYLFVVEIMFDPRFSELEFDCGRVLHKFPFPRLSEELVETLENRDIIPLLSRASHGPSQVLQIFAISQLWILCALESYERLGTEAIRSRLNTQLARCTSWGNPAAMKRSLAHRLLLNWQLPTQSLPGVSASLERELWKGYLSRVMECVVDAGDHITPCTEVSVGRELDKNWLDIENMDLNPKLRGLASFTAYPFHDDPTAEQELYIPRISFYLIRHGEV